MAAEWGMGWGAKARKAQNLEARRQPAGSAGLLHTHCAREASEEIIGFWILLCTQVYQHIRVAY